MEPLQTHGKYKETWNPPQSDRFTVYERSDESWLRPLGLGAVTKTLLNLFDVRLQSNGDLVGYINQNPAECRYGRMRFVTLLNGGNLAYEFRLDNPAFVTEPKFSEIELSVSQFSFDSRRYLSWMVDDSDVPALARSNIFTHGPDNKEEFLYELRKREWMSRFRA